MNGKNINPKKAMMGPKTSFTTSKQINKPQNAVTTYINIPTRKSGLRRIALNRGLNVSLLLIRSASTSLTSIISFSLFSDNFN